MDEGSATKQCQFPQAQLLSLPSELLINDILSCLPIPSLPACSRTCKLLNNLISSSLLLTYLKELTIAGLLHNSTCPYTSYPISKRLDMLRERERRWLHLDPKWRRQVDMVAPQDRYHIYDIVSGHLLFGVTKFDIPGAVASLRLPVERESDLHWEEAADVGQDIINFGMALEEHDLIACLIRTNINNNPTFQFQVHLINHSTAEHHSSACIPIINIHAPYLQSGEVSGDIAVCGENLAVSLKYPIGTDTNFIHRLYIWNWKTGILKSEFELDSASPNSGLGTPCLTFLREDILLYPNAMVNSLDVYHIPYSPLTPDSCVCMISRFELPRLAKYFPYYFIQSHLSPSPRSSPVPHHLSTKKPYLNNPERSILGLVFDVFNNERWIHFSLLVRWQYLLARSLEHLAEINRNPGCDVAYPIYPWDKWGPRNSRLIPAAWYNPFIMTTTGSRLVSLVKNTNQSRKEPRAKPPRTVEVYDFDETRIRIAGQQAPSVKHKGRSVGILKTDASSDTEERKDNDSSPQPLVELVDSNTPSIYPTSNGIFTKKVCTYLPYLRTTYAVPAIGGRLRNGQKKLAEWMKERFRHRRGSPSGSPEYFDANRIDSPRESPAHPSLCQWDGLMVDDERIIGMTFDTEVEGRCRELDILYLG